MLLESLPTFNSENIAHEMELSNNTINGITIKDNKTISSGNTSDSTVLTDTLPRQDIADETNIQISSDKNPVDLEADSPIEDRYLPSSQPTKDPLESLSLAQNNQTTTGTSEVPNNTTNTAAQSSSKIDDNLDKTSNFSIGGLPTEPSPLSASTSFPSEPIETQVETTILPMMEPLSNEGQGYTSEVKNVTPNNDNDRTIDDTQLEMISSGQAQNKPIFSEIFESLSLNNRGADQDKEKADEAKHSLAKNNSFNDQLMTEVTEEEPYYDMTIHTQHVKVTSTSAGEGSNNIDLETAATVQTVSEYTNEATTVDYTTETVVQGHETTFSSFNMEEEIKTDIPPIVPATTLDSMAVDSETYNQEIALFNESADNLTLNPAGNFTHFREEELGNLTGVTISPLATETTEEQPIALTRTGQEMDDGMTVIPAEESTLSPNWPDLEQINTHPVVSETTFDLPSSGGPVASEIPEDILASQTDLPHEPFFRHDHLENGTHAEILGAGSNDSDLRKRELNKTTGNRQAKRLALFDETGLIVANSTDENSVGKLIVDNLETTPSTDTIKVPSEELEGPLITNTQEPQQISSTGSSLQPPAEFVASTVTSEKEAANLTELEQNLGANSTSNLDQLVPQIPSSNSSFIGVGGLELGQTSSSSSNKSDNWNEISTENPPTTVTVPELTTIISEDLSDSYTTEPYATLFPTEVPSVISVVTQSNLTEPVAPTVDGPLISGPLNVSDEQVALASSGDGVSNKTKEPFICTEHGVFPDIYDCKQYFLCVAQPGGYVKITGVCPSRYAFNFDIQRCVRDVSTCYEDKCTREGNSTDPADDTSYFWCNEIASGIFHKYHLQCDPPMKFIQELNMCGDPNSVTLGGFVMQNETGQIINGTKFEDFKMETTLSPADSDQFPTTILIEPEFREMPATTNKYETAFIESFPVDDQNAVLSDPVGKTIQADDNPAPLSRTVRSLSEANLFRCPDQGIYAHPLNCSQYYMCSRNAFNEITEILRNCPERYAYRPDIKGCSRDLSGCLSLHVHCKGAGNFAHPEDESSYYRCVPNATGGLRIYSIKCEGLKKFDSTRGACVTIENPASSSSLPLTVNKIEPSTSESRRISKRSTVVPLSEQQTEPKDRVLGYWEPVVSERYRKEAEGRLRGILDVMRDEASRKHEVKLDEKRYFDKMEDDGEVDTDEEVNESSRTLVVALRQEESPEERATPSEFRCREEGRFPDPTDCKMYYICSARRTGDLKLHHLECRGSDRFDARKRICVEGEDASCA
ncbi:flocculation protein FLO11-like isoform X1 [Hermetia illucens]|nr:flocculation protein FLO11-like isoform X1 [Hermetia illucens]